MACLWAGPLVAESGPRFVSRTWRTQDGLPENRIRAIAQTPDGYLWVGTSSGVARFDGVRFTVYSRVNTPSMRDDNVRFLSVARDGALWLATDGGGVLRYRSGLFESFGPEQGLANEFVGAVLEDRRGDVWAATNRGLYRGRGGRFVRVDEPLHLSNIAFFCLRELSDGTLLAGGPSGLFRIEDGAPRPFGVGAPDGVYHIGQTRDGHLWLGTSHGLRVVGGTDPGGFAKTMIPAVTQDHAGGIWVGTGGAGLFLKRHGSADVLRVEVDLPDQTVSAVVEDREQNVWVGTSDGLVRLSAPEIETLGRRNGLADENVTTLYCDPRGGLWLSTAAGGAFRYSGGRMEAFPLPAIAAGLRLRSTYLDRRGALWFGTDNQGAVRTVGGKATRFTIEDGLRNNGIQGFLEDREGRLWIATTSGLSRWDGSRFTNFYLPEGLSYGWVRAMALDGNGELLVGTDRGLNRLRDGRFVADPEFQALARDRVWAIYPDGRGTIWVGTRGGGLVRLRDGKAARITTRHGLSSDAIFRLMGDASGRLWMSGPMGISAARIADLDAVAEGREASLAVLAYGTGDGLESAQMNGGVEPAGCVDGAGDLWFPSVKGAVRVRPGVARAGQAAPVHVESVTVDDRTLPAAAEVTVGPGRQRVRIDFTACSLRSPERVSFQYRLVGFDPDWIAAAGRRSAGYDNLPPGRFRFLVQARDQTLSTGYSSEAELALVVRPYFHQTVWFYGLAAGLVGVVVVGVVWRQGRQARARYSLRLAERTRIAREMHDTVVQGCVGVSTLLEAAVGAARADQDLMLECLDNARIHLRLTLDEARQALSDLRHDSFEHGLAGALSDLARAMTAERGVAVSLEVVGEPGPLSDATNRALLLVAREAIRNAVTHGAPSAVRLRLRREAAALRMDIRDDGRGFQRSPATLADEGHFGILGMRERMEQIGGALEVASRPGEGTTVTATLPLGEHREAS
jgi:ligand-binding sensor domain-containing protein/signal transduction histidine kinase